MINCTGCRLDGVKTPCCDSPCPIRQCAMAKGVETCGRCAVLVLADDDEIFGSSMSDSTRAMVTENAKDILVVIYCFENNIDLDVLLSEARNAFERFAAAENIDSWIYINRDF